MFVSDWYWFFFCSDTFFDVLRRNKNRCGFIVVFKGAYNQKQFKVDITELMFRQLLHCLLPN